MEKEVAKTIIEGLRRKVHECNTKFNGEEYIDGLEYAIELIEDEYGIGTEWPITITLYAHGTTETPSIMEHMIDTELPPLVD